MLELENSDQVSQEAHIRSTCLFVCLFLCLFVAFFRVVGQIIEIREIFPNVIDYG